ncbi:MAG TPA: hypothetical protein ENK28_04120, partial [Aliiroseovarius sp.]|nr:hypothetical protein [Aliiroseovarius sp.]
MAQYRLGAKKSVVQGRLAAGPESARARGNEMTLETPLDHVHADMVADIDDDTARLTFYSQLADAELFVFLERDAGEDSISPEILDLEGDMFALVFDREDRLADFAKKPVPYAALPGRVIAGMLAGKNIGLALNLSVAPSSILIPPGAMDWLKQALSVQPGGDNGSITCISPPDENARALVPALTQKLSNTGGLVDKVFLAQATFSDGRVSALLAFVDAAEHSHDALAGTAQEA